MINLSITTNSQLAEYASSSNSIWHNIYVFLSRFFELFSLQNFGLLHYIIIFSVLVSIIIIAFAIIRQFSD